MRQYEDPKQHLQRHINRAAENYLAGMRELGVEPKPTLPKAVIDRTIREAQADYQQSINETFLHNMQILNEQYNQERDEIARKGAARRLRVCLPLIAIWAAAAWYNFIHTSDPKVWIACAFGALVFLAMLVFGKIFDPPKM